MPTKLSMRFRHTLAFKIATAVFIASSLIFLGNYFGNYRALERALSSNVRTTIAQTSQLLNTAVSATSNVPSGDLHTMEAFFTEMVKGDGKSGVIYVVVKKENGSTLLSAGLQGGDIPLPDAPSQFESCAARGLCHVRDPILLEGNDIGFLQYGLATASNMAALTQAYTNSLALTSAATLLIFAAIAVYGLRVARRAARLRRASSEIAMGNYSIRVKIDGHDELSDLSENFNRMSEAIEAKVKEVSRLTEGLELRVQERTEALQTSNQLLAANALQLEAARAQLVQSEKLAGLGALVAGISHELNTPIGNALVAATSVHQLTRDLVTQLDNQKVSRKSFEDFVQTLLEGSALVERSVSRAANLISSFKQVAVDQASERRRSFDLAQMVHEVVSTLNHSLKNAPQPLTVSIASGIVLDSYPGPLGQVITNLINNALIHAFENATSGEMTLRAATTSAGHVLIEFTDNGRGISNQHVNRIFDPFFTTRLGLGGGGLGLSITNNIVEGLLGGSIKVESMEGVGTSFFIDVPLVAP